MVSERWSDASPDSARSGDAPRLSLPTTRTLSGLDPSGRTDSDGRVDSSGKALSNFWLFDSKAADKPKRKVPAATVASTTRSAAPRRIYRPVRLFLWSES